MNSKKDEFKKLFYSNLTEFEIKQKLNLNYREYKKLLTDVKKELGLPSKYRRTPKTYGSYTKDSYYILKRKNEEFEIVSYYPTVDWAEHSLNDILDLNDGYNYEIKQATDENLMELIYEEYYIKHNNWEGIIQKCKIPYHKFYYLLSIIKKNISMNHLNTYRDKRFVYKYRPTKKFVVKKYVNGKYVHFGYYDNEDIAIHVRNYLESIGWNFNLWENNKSKVVGEISNE